GGGRTLVRRLFDQLTALGEKGIFPQFLIARQFHAVTGEQMAEQLQVPGWNVLVQPAPRNTLSTVLWARASIAKHHPDATILVLNGDNRFETTDHLRRDLGEAIGVAQAESAFVLFGVEPYADHRLWNRIGVMHSEGQPAYQGWRAHRIVSFEE